MNYRIEAPVRTVRNWRPFRIAPHNLLIVDGTEEEERQILFTLSMAGIEVLEIESSAFYGIDLDDLGQKALFIRDLDKCPQRSVEEMRALLFHALERDRLVVATAHSDLVAWDGHKSLLETFPEAKHLFAGERAITARNVWGKTVEDNPDLDDFLYDEMERLAEHRRFTWNIDPRRVSA